jgi:hypothetical protein
MDWAKMSEVRREEVERRAALERREEAKERQRQAHNAALAKNAKIRNPKTQCVGYATNSLALFRIDPKVFPNIIVFKLNYAGILPSRKFDLGALTTAPTVLRQMSSSNNECKDTEGASE